MGLYNLSLWRETFCHFWYWSISHVFLSFSFMILSFVLALGFSLEFVLANTINKENHILYVCGTFVWFRQIWCQLHEIWVLQSFVQAEVINALFLTDLTYNPHSFSHTQGYCSQFGVNFFMLRAILGGLWPTS